MVLKVCVWGGGDTNIPLSPNQKCGGTCPPCPPPPPASYASVIIEVGLVVEVIITVIITIIINKQTNKQTKVTMPFTYTLEDISGMMWKKENSLSDLYVPVSLIPITVSASVCAPSQSPHSPSMVVRFRSLGTSRVAVTFPSNRRSMSHTDDLIWKNFPTLRSEMSALSYGMVIVWKEPETSN